ncbi:MAG: FAD-dependent oxidoreductase [Acidimicrobiia bacterium]|jgi:glycine/D-amino acid oxidase-like deaminating enzyme/nitrite reductase/ring-hydroxylating ferredoxin subunit
MSEHESVWRATAPLPTFAPLGGDLQVDVAVVGGGITGLTTALMLQGDGARVALVEARRIGAGTTGGTTGKVTSQHALTYATLVEQHGEERARAYADANQQAIGTVAGLVVELGIDCQLTRAPAFVYASDAGGCAELEAEHEAALALGLPARLTDEVDLPFPVELALRFDDQAHLHPGAYLAGLATAFVEGGGVLADRTRAMGIEEADASVEVHTEHGTVAAGHVVVATLLPIADRGGFFAKARPTRGYGIAVRLASGGIDGMHIDVGSTRSTRPWDDDGRPGVIVVGETHETGQEEHTPARWGELERWVRERFEVDSIAYRWSAQDFTSVDELPYVGRSPRSERVLVATGMRKWGLTNGTAAAQILTDLVAGRDNPWHEAFDATRIGGAASVKDLVQDNLQVGRELVDGYVGRVTAGAVDHLAPGEGGLAKVDGHTVGAYRDPSGQVHAVSATCTHMGCTLQWNRAETSWDCPCHGSRFDTGGTVLEGPAVRALDRVELAKEPEGR